MVPQQSLEFSNEAVAYENETLPKDMIKSIIKKYYSSILNDDYETFFSLFSPKVDRLFSLYNTTPAQAVAEQKKYSSRWKLISNTTNWETLYITPLSDETYYVTFNIDNELQKVASGLNKSFKS